MTEEDKARASKTLWQLIQEDINDPNTPSKLESLETGEGFEWPAHELREGEDEG